MKEISESLMNEILEVESKLKEVLEELEKTKKGTKASAQRFRVKSNELSKLMKALRKSTLSNG